MSHSWIIYSQFRNAILSNNLTVVEDLLRKGVDYDYRFDNTKIPALCISCKCGHYEMACLLLNYGCSVNQSDEHGRTALHFSCSFVFIDITRLLIHHRASVNASSFYDGTPLHLAVQQNSLGTKNDILHAYWIYIFISAQSWFDYSSSLERPRRNRTITDKHLCWLLANWVTSRWSTVWYPLEPTWMWKTTKVTRRYLSQSMVCKKTFHFATLFRSCGKGSK